MQTTIGSCKQLRMKAKGLGFAAAKDLSEIPVGLLPVVLPNPYMVGENLPFLDQYHTSVLSGAAAVYVADKCHLLSGVVHRPVQSSSNDNDSCHQTHLVTGVSRPLVLNCGTIFHFDYGGRDSFSISLDNL